MLHVVSQLVGLVVLSVHVIWLIFVNTIDDAGSDGDFSACSEYMT